MLDVLSTESNSQKKTYYMKIEILLKLFQLEIKIRNVVSPCRNKHLDNMLVSPRVRNIF